MRKAIFGLGVVAVLTASFLLLISQNSMSASELAPSDMQVTSIPKTTTIPLQLHAMSANTTVPIFDSTAWIPTKSLTTQFQSEMVDVSQYRSMSVLIAPWPARTVNSSDTVIVFASEIEKTLMGIQTFVTFVDPETGASTTVQIDKDTHSIPVAGPIAFVSIGLGSHAHVNADPSIFTVALYLST